MTGPAPTATAIVVPVPAADPVVDAHRRVLDLSATWGVPAHVTVLYPFVAPALLTDDTVDAVRDRVRTVAAFDCVFGEVRWFGEDAVWLAPDPVEPFRALTEAVWRRFPDHPPYEGRWSEVVPHLTIASAPLGDLAAMRLAARRVRERVPVRARVDRVLLLAGTDAPRSWRTVAEIPLPGA